MAIGESKPSRVPARRLTLVALAAWLIILSGGFVSPALAQPAGPPKLKDLNGHFPMTVPETAEAWQARAEALRLQTRVALGLHPMPELADPTPTIYGRESFDGYTIEKLILESLPGHFITASLYRPVGDAAEGTRRPAVMYAHGHWNDGRFYEASPGEVARLIATGAERFENAAINHMQAACVQLARMGIVVVQYDMIGYADSQQISFDRAHRYGINDSDPPTTDDGWPLFTATAEGYGQSIMGLQTINSIQIFEMLRRLPDVDGERVAITGASGGGTQSFIATAVDTRIAGSLPAVMVSTGMQGGCTCENACGLRVATGNIELAALTAPRPLGLTTANDWTIRLPEDGFPELQQVYRMLGRPDAVRLFPGAHFPHNYNHVARTSMYGWMNQLFGLGLTEPVLERDFELVRKDRLTVWDDEHPRPESGVDHERKLTKAWAAQIDAATRPSESDSPEVAEQKRKLVTEGWGSILAWADAYRGMEAGNVKWSGPRAGQVVVASPPVPLTPSDDGIVELHFVDFNSRTIFANSSISVRDPFGGDERDRSPLVSNPRPAAAYTYGYNAPPTVRRLGVLLDALQAARGDRDFRYRLVVGDNEIVLAAAAAVAWPEGISDVVWKAVATADFDPLAEVSSIRDPNFIPNGLRYRGLAGLVSVLDDRLTRVGGGGGLMGTKK
ncbi:MAG: hypothetical protein EA381_13660 [Planctomycetaceae bacterium]|nr:MAG: hypothetical protein EA381_13660 [Planctomycetaceae bacterium]